MCAAESAVNSARARCAVTVAMFKRVHVPHLYILCISHFDAFGASLHIFIWRLQVSFFRFPHQWHAGGPSVQQYRACPLLARHAWMARVLDAQSRGYCTGSISRGDMFRPKNPYKCHAPPHTRTTSVPTRSTRRYVVVLPSGTEKGLLVQYHCAPGRPHASSYSRHHRQVDHADQRLWWADGRAMTSNDARAVSR